MRHIKRGNFGSSIMCVEKNIIGGILGLVCRLALVVALECACAD